MTDAVALTASDVTILRGLKPEHKETLVQLFCKTFPEVVVPVFGSAERCARLLEVSIEEDRILSAVLDGHLVGFSGLHYSGHEWFDPNLAQLFAIMRWRVFRVIAVGIILFKRPKPDTLHIDTLAVHPHMRGQGIGAQLIQAVEARAQSEGKQRVTLEVEDINPRAKRLYERNGFTEQRFEKLLWPWSQAFEFSGSYWMSKAVVLSDQSHTGRKGSAAREEPQALLQGTGNTACSLRETGRNRFSRDRFLPIPNATALLDRTIPKRRPQALL